MRVGLFFLSLAVTVLLPVCAAVQCLPASSWIGCRIEQTADRLVLVGAKDEKVVTVTASPKDFDLRKIRVDVTPEGFSVEAGEAFSAGLASLTFRMASVDLAPLKGRSCSFLATASAPEGSDVRFFLEGAGPRPIGHFHRSVPIRPLGFMRTAMLFDVALPTGLETMHARFDIRAQRPGTRVLLKSVHAAPADELRGALVEKAVQPTLLFRADFDGMADAFSAGGRGAPLKAENLSFVPGIKGKAVRFRGSDHPVLEYAFPGNVAAARGTVALWVKREWDLTRPKQPWRALFAFEGPGLTSLSTRYGRGAHVFWFYGSLIRADMCDDSGVYRAAHWPDRKGTDWVHLAFAWNEDGIRIYVNGRQAAGRDDWRSPMVRALKTATLWTLMRPAFTSFSVGGIGGGETADCLVDDLRIYSGVLDDEAIRCLFEEVRLPVAQTRTEEIPDYGRLFARDGANRYEAPATGTGVPDDLELVDEIRLDDAGIRQLERTDRFRAKGSWSVKRLGNVPYFETGEEADARAAFRFRIDTNAPLYCFEFDYPDDRKRTADLIVQPVRGGGYENYALQVGYWTGDETPNTGRILTHRCLYWAEAADVAAVIRTVHAGQPAALSAIRLYRVRSGRLPVADVSEPKTRVDGWNRTFALYYEDPVVGTGFGLPLDETATPRGTGELIDRVAATMKYTGQNLLAYPGVWYRGVVGPEGHGWHNHAPAFLRAWYVKFGKEGLGVVPSLNPNVIIPQPDGPVTFESMSDGSLHPTEFAIHDTGLPNWGKWHDTPPNYNFMHPKVRRYIENAITALIRQGKDYPAFKGICLHVTKHCFLTFGSDKSGYNDYTVRAFARDCAIDLPFDRFADNPLRGRDYAQWIRANCREKWIQWRCDQVTAFYARIAEDMAKIRPDLKLWVNAFIPSCPTDENAAEDDYMRSVARGAGLDGPALQRRIPNLILCQTVVPADYRKDESRKGARPEARARQRIESGLADTYSLLDGACYPFVNQHDRYWESSIGKRAGSLSGDWLSECSWRVTTLNPSGRHALAPFARPFRYHDVLGMSKGGFLVGTYGMEDVLVPFIRAFRALPAKVMEEVGRVDAVVARRTVHDRKVYFYFVNTGDRPVRLRVRFPQGTVDLVSGATSDGAEEVRLDLAAYDLRSFAAPYGSPDVVFRLAGEEIQ